MEYYSTRDKSVRYTSAEAIKQGLSAEGGLFWPMQMPKLEESVLREMVNMTYCERAKTVFSQFLTDFTPEEIEHCVSSAYTAEKFGSADITPVHKLDDNAYVLELWHGPTCAFKDVALQILPHFLTTSMKKLGEDKKVVILVATSGDTGKAALEGFCDVEGTSVVVFYPSEGVSEVQRAQMVTQKGDNTFVAAVKGNFDDCQTGVKKIFGSVEIAQKMHDNGYVFSSANSINWGRLVPQVVYYFSAYCDMVRDGEIAFGDKLRFVVPTGNFGDILAGYVAKQMGLPVEKLVCASNKNNVLTDFIQTGSYDKNRDFHTTMSPSMDILVSSNLERLLFMLLDGNDQKTADCMEKLQKEGCYTIDPVTLSKLQSDFIGGYTNEKETTDTIAACFAKYGYTIDPHTAVAMHVYEQNKSDVKSVILSTASPYKFPKSVAIGIAPESVGDDEWKLFSVVKEKSGFDIPASLSGLRERPVRFDRKCDAPEMIDAVTDFLKIY